MSARSKARKRAVDLLFEAEQRGLNARDLLTERLAKPVTEAHSSTELIELTLGKAADAPLCMTCGTKMRPAGSCYVCEGCGSTSGCS